jgi:hypothetical protein
MSAEEKREEQKENLYRHTKQFIQSIKTEKIQLKRRLQEIERLEKEILLILSNPELAEEILKGSDKE